MAIPEQPMSDYVDLPNGEKVLVECTWLNKAERIVGRAVLFYEAEGQPRSRREIGSFDGPMSHEEANKIGTQMALDWYEKRNG